MVNLGAWRGEPLRHGFEDVTYEIPTPFIVWEVGQPIEQVPAVATHHDNWIGPAFA